MAAGPEPYHRCCLKPPLFALGRWGPDQSGSHPQRRRRHRGITAGAQLLDTDGARLYIDQPVVEELASEQGLAAESVVTIGIVPTQAGTLALPDINVYWWNTEERRQEVAVLLGVNLAIGAAPQAAPALGAATVPQPLSLDNA